MKNSVQPQFSAFSRQPRRILFALLLGLIGLHRGSAENVQEARVTRIVKDVKLLGATAAARPAALSDTIRPGNGVRTGTDSRAELTFTDLSITRLGANTVFSFNGAGRTVDLGGGAVLVEAPPNAEAIHVNTAAFSAAISGGTGLIEYHLGGVSKVLVLEGHGGVTPAGGNPNDIIVVPAGDMITLGPDGKWTKPQKFNVALVMKSSNLITDFGSLPNEQLIFEVIDSQKNDFGYPNGEPPHDTTLDATIDRNDAAPPGGTGQSPTPPPNPGNIPLITSPNPYVIGSGTTITTDPTITTNGQTDQGAIYQGQAIDGPLSAFIFGSTSSFDTASGFDSALTEESTAALFKFTALQLTGNPTIDTTNGPVDLGLIALDSITSGGPGGSVTFSGLNGVLLATQNGPITLGSEISFANIHDLNFYARGANGDLSLGSAISGLTHTRFFAEQSMSLSSTVQSETISAISGGDMTIHGTDTLQASGIELFSFQALSWDGETSDVEASDSSNNSVTIEANGDINVTNDLSFTRHSASTAGIQSQATDTSQSVDLTLSGGQDVTIGGILSLVVDNSSGGGIDAGGNITVNANGNLTVSGSGGITLNVLNQGGSIGNGGNISVNVGGDLKAEGLSSLINNRNSGSIGNGVGLSISVGGALNLDSGSQLEISNRADNSESSGGTIAGDALVSVSAGSISGTNAEANWEITNGDGGHIQGNATISANVTGNAGFAHGGLFDIENNSFNTLQGGLLDGNAVIDFSAANVSSGDGSLSFIIHNQGNGDGASGQIDGNATMTIHAANLASASSDRGDIIGLIDNHSGGTIANNASVSLTATGAVGSTFAGNVNFSILNDNFAGIGGDASVTAQMASLAAGNSTSFAIDNSDGGFINGNASVAVTVTGTGGVNLPNQATFEIDNTGLASIQDSIQPQEGPPPIGGNASVNLNIQHGGLMDDDGLEVRISNGGDAIGGAATISATVANAIQINAGDANFEILNGGGFIGGSASVTASAGSMSANNILAQINNSNGDISGGANIALNVAGDVTTSGANGITLQLLNEGGFIGTGAAGDGVSYTAGGTTTTSQLTLYVDNSQDGVIGRGGNVTLHTTGPVTLVGGLGLDVDNFAGGNITTGGNITAHFGGDVTTTNGSMHSFNFFMLNGGNYFVGPLAGGTITTGGNINLTFDGNATTTPTSTTGSWTAEVANDGGSIGTGGNDSVTVAGNVTGNIFGVDVSNRNGGHIVNGGNVTVDVGGAVTTSTDAEFQVFNNGGTIDSVPVVTVHGGSFNVGGNLIAAVDNETGSIGGGSGTGSTTFQSDGAVTVTGGMYVLGHATAGGDINVGTMASTDVTTTGNINAGNGGITRFHFIEGQNTMPDVLHTLTAAQVTSTGGINFNGSDADEFNEPTDGGRLTINANSLSFGPTGNIQGSVTLNGGAGFTNSNESVIPAASGGTLRANTTGAITVDADIEATTGAEPDGVDYSGQGGTVALKSTGGAVTVNNRIEVSSNDPIPSQTPPPPARRSASGGTILLQSNLTTGTGITISSGGQLLSLLSLDALNTGGTPGSITLSTMGADIVVNGEVRADFGTITLDQNDPAGSTPTITIDGATVQAATFNINGSGDLSIGPNNATAINIFGGTWNVAHDITLNAANTTFAYAFALNASAGNAINFTGGTSDSSATLAFPLSGDTTFTAGAGGINAPFIDFESSAANLNLISAGSISVHSIDTGGFLRGTIAANGGALNVTTNLGSSTVSALTDINVGGYVVVGSLDAGGAITVGGSMGAFGAISASGDITAGGAEVSSGGITTAGNVIAGDGGIHPFVVSPGGAAEQDFVTANTVVSPNGLDFSGNQYGGIDGLTSAGLLTLNVASINFDSSSGVGAANFNGADAGATDGDGNVFATVGGNGGSLIVNATGNITANSGTNITATTGNNASGDNGFSGAGGTVTLASTGGTVTVGDTIQVSSDDPIPSQSPPPPIRRSAQGGNINIQSGKPTGTAIQVTSTAQLLSLLDNAASGPGGVITVKATGASSAVNVQGQVEADRGTIDIEQTGTNGSVVLGNDGGASISGTEGFSPAALNMRADIIKVGALGADGTLLVGNANLNADTLIALYGGSSGSVEFNADVTLSNATTKIIAANTVTIDNGVTVTIVGAAADVYTNHAHYDVASGGDGTGGSFAGGVNTHLGGTPPPFGQTSSVAQNTSASRGRNAARGTAASPARTSTTSTQTTRSPLGTIQRTGILH